MEIKTDYHLHTWRCKHATGEMEFYVEQAILLNLEEIAFTDHIPLPDEFDIEHRMDRTQLDDYIHSIENLKKSYPEIKIKSGIEADYYEGYEKYTEDILSQYPFDIVLMAVHFIKHWSDGNWVFGYQFPGKSITEIYQDYLNTVIRGIRTGLFDVVAHIDLVKKAGAPLIDHIPNEFRNVLREIKNADMAIELNTSGRRKSIGEFFPSPELWVMIFEERVPFTVGSDAHSPVQVGLFFENLETMLPIAPVRYDKRRMKKEPLLYSDIGEL
jgi:histidinol-phosphatase (PHP family)